MASTAALSADDIEVPRWVCPEHRGHYRKLAAAVGEEQAAAWAREAKRTGIADLPASLSGSSRAKAAAPAPAPAAPKPRKAQPPAPPKVAKPTQTPAVATPRPRPAAAPKEPRPAPMPKTEPAPAPEKADDGPISIFDLKSRSCRWPIDGDGETLYCGRTSIEQGRPYCADHTARAAVPRGARSNMPEEM